MLMIWKCYMDPEIDHDYCLIRIVFPLVNTCDVWIV